MLPFSFVLLSSIASLVDGAVMPVISPREVQGSNVTVGMAADNFRAEAANTPNVVTVLTADQVAAFTPYTQLARAAYCASSKITNWRCGAACNAIPGFEPTLTGGDGNSVQLYFAGYWPQQNAVVVVHQGTDPTQFLSVLTDANIIQKALDSTLFPGVPSGVTVHGGFADAHADTAQTILTETERLISTKRATTVILVGHSLGGALAELDALYMKLNLPSNIQIKAVTYGTPRVGNPTFSAYFDSQVPDFQRVNNEKDPIPIIPGRGLDFQHPHGEVHFIFPGNAVACPGDDDATDAQCTIATVPNIFDGDITNHLGPYEGIFIGTLFCT